MRKISIVLLFISFISQSLFAQNTNFTLDDIWLNFAYYPQSVRGIRSMNDGEHYTIMSQGHIDKYSYKVKGDAVTIVKKTDLLPEGEKKPLNIVGYEFSSDETKLLVYTNKESIYRHSFKAEYWVYDIASKKLEKLAPGLQQLAAFSPAGDKVGYVENNNIYVKNLVDGKIIAVTEDGLMNKIINGAPDWVYEEEFSFSKAWQWSPDGNKIAFLRFDESQVKQWDMKMYGDLYPDIYRFKYPKAGEDNSLVSVHVYDLSDGSTSKMDIGEETDIYIPRIQWVNVNELSIQRLNRLQNVFEILVSDYKSGKSKVIYYEKNKYYVEVTDNLKFLNDGSGFVLTSEKSGFNHIYMYDMKGANEKQLTEGSWDVMSLLGVNEKDRDVYYISAESSPLDRDLYKVNMKKGKKTKLSDEPGSYTADFSKTFDYYVGSYSTINTPPVYSVFDKKGKKLYDFKDNKAMADRLKTAGYNDVEFFKFTTDYNVELNAYMVKPKNFDPQKRYPVLVHTYGGPGAQRVTNSWQYFNMMWFQMLAQEDILVCVVDPRGTGARGEEFKKMTYMQLGKYETEDMISTAKYLGEQTYIDSKRIGIFGWSYGGYMATLCMTKGANYYSTGIAVAPVTNWRYYDNIYTERFMRTPQENADGYDENSPISHVNKLKGNFLLVHGTADDNVHIQNSMDLIDALVKHNKQFEMQFYVNDNHSIWGGRYNRFHLFTRMTDFLKDNL